jgi:hypothetical protein
LRTTIRPGGNVIQRLIPLFLVSWTAVAMAQAPEFAAPVRIEAGTKLLGENRLYPSPMLHDVNGDGLLDIVVGDLRGKITYALREKGDSAPRYGEEQKMLAADGKELDFQNW